MAVYNDDVIIPAYIKAGRAPEDARIYIGGGYLGLTGLATLIGSLNAVREIVYNKKQMTLAEFTGVLRNTFEGNETLRRYILNKLPKHGNNDAEVMKFSTRVFADLAEAASGFPNGRGGKVKV